MCPQHLTTLRVVVLLGSLFAEEARSATVSARKSPQYQNSFQFPLPIPIVKKPLVSYKDPKTGTPIDFYEVEAKEFTNKFYPNLESANLFGYDGSFPGPTFRIEKGTETVVRVVNKGQTKMNAHLHGSFCRPLLIRQL